MNQYTWTDPLCGDCRAFPSTADSQLGALAREILRLAQREDDLLTRANEALSVLQVTQPPFAEAVHVLAARAETLAVLYHTTQAARATLVDERDALVRRVDGLVLRVQELEGQTAFQEAELTGHRKRLTEKEHQLALAKASVEAQRELKADLEKELRAETRRRQLWENSARQTGERLVAAEQKLAAEESKGRHYTAELAEKAEEIRRLQEQVVGLGRAGLLAASQLNDRESAIQAALGHVEAANTHAVNFLAPGPWRAQLALAREALAGAGKAETVPGGVHYPKAQDDPREHTGGVCWCQIEERDRRRESGLAKIEARLGNLEGRLTNHSNRLRHLEAGKG